MAYDGGGEGPVAYEGGKDEEKVRISSPVDVASERATDERDPMVLASMGDVVSRSRVEA